MSTGDLSKDLQKKSSKERQKMKKEFFISVFFDGTWNKGTEESPQQSDTNVYALSCLSATGKKIVSKYENVMRCYTSVYVEGPGTAFDGETHEEIDEASFWKRVGQTIDKAVDWGEDKIGSVTGALTGTWHRGVVDKVAKGVSLVIQYLTPLQYAATDTYHFNVFGFSRGAACARMFAYFVARNPQMVTLDCEKSIQDYLLPCAKSIYDTKKGRLAFLENVSGHHNGVPTSNKSVDFLGLFDTVSSIGVKDKNDIMQYHSLNAEAYGLYSPHLLRVKRTFHICAIDEFRKNFAVTDVGKNVPQRCIEVFVPGCHSDVGGGYEENENSTVFIRTKKDGKPTYIVTKDPRSPDKGKMEVSKKSLKSLGWATERTFWASVGDAMRKAGYGLVNDDLHVLSFTHKVKRGLSNITMKMMWERVKKDIGESWHCNPFKALPKTGDFIVPDDLAKNYGKLFEVDEMEPQKRYWIIPGGSLDSDSYKKLRSEYIHFEATDLPLMEIGFGPNWKDNLLCRIVYHGDKNDSGVYYMQDY